MRINVSILHVLTVVFVAFLSYSPLVAAPGDLDPSFGNIGRIWILDTVPIPTRVRLESDGKLVTVAEDCIVSGESYLSRHNQDGTPDQAFGPNGTGISYLNDPVCIRDVVVLPDGKFLTTGHWSIGPGERKLAVFRFLPTGTLDPTFGAGGRVVWSGGNNSTGERIERQPDGKIVVAGRRDLHGTDNETVLIRIDPDGSFDTGFGVDGAVVSEYGGNVTHTHEVLIQPDGKILIAAASLYAAAQTSGLARYHSDGSIDGSFGTHGILNTAGIGYFGGAVLQVDGKILVSGRTSASQSEIKRYDPAGNLDITFGADGVVTIDDPAGSAIGMAHAMAIQGTGKILTAGGRRGNFAISRFMQDGTIDTAFGVDGLVLTTFAGPDPRFDSVQSLAVQPDGKIIASGSVSGGSGMARYINDPIDAPFDFDGDGSSDISVFRPSDETWYIDRSSKGFSATPFGLATDYLTPADFDGDGKTDIAVFRDGTWWWINSSDHTVAALQFGLSGDIPVPADYTGDGRDDLAIYRYGDWWIYDRSGDETTVLNFGLDTDLPVPADFDGDGRVDPAVLRHGGSELKGSLEWHLNQSKQGYAVVQFGLPTDRPVAGDYDGDGRADAAVYRDGTWQILRSSKGYIEIQWGLSTDIPTPADYDGDGRTDAAIYRDGTWWIWQSTGGISATQFGLSSDRPLPAVYLR